VAALPDEQAAKADIMDSDLFPDATFSQNWLMNDWLMNDWWSCPTSEPVVNGTFTQPKVSEI
jgi:hypothetical protein